MKLVIEFDGDRDKSALQVSHALMFLAGAVKALTITDPRLRQAGNDLSQRIDGFLQLAASGGR
jgi:hypothetical protein